MFASSQRPVKFEISMKNKILQKLQWERCPLCLTDFTIELRPIGQHSPVVGGTIRMSCEIDGSIPTGLTPTWDRAQQQCYHQRYSFFLFFSFSFLLAQFCEVKHCISVPNMTCTKCIWWIDKIFFLKPLYSIGGFEWIFISPLKSTAFSVQTSENSLKLP